MPNRARGLRARDLVTVVTSLASSYGRTRDDLAGMLGVAERTIDGHISALRRMGARIARFRDPPSYAISASPAEIVALLEAIAAPKTQATSRACEKSTPPTK